MINQIGSTASSATAPAPGGKLGKDEFLKMLVAQMRNQDPLNPLQGEEMAAQLAQFSSLEQLTNINTGLENLTAVIGLELMHSMNASNALGVLGRTVTVVGDKLQVGENGATSLNVQLGERAASGTLRIFDSNGREVGSHQLGAMAAGRQTLPIEDAVKDLPPGMYSYKVEAKNADAEPVPVTTYSRLVVDGVRYGPDGPILTAGGLTLPFASIVEIGTR